MDYLSNKIDSAHIERVLKKRDRRLWLDMESSSLSGILIRPMVNALPKKKFILTFRDVFSWCESWMDHDINSPPAPGADWTLLDRLRLKTDSIKPTRHDAPLVESGLHPLACYFQLWQSHNQEVLSAVPEERLLTIKTTEIVAKIPVIADFVGVPAHQLKADRGWLFAASRKHRSLAKLDPVYVADTAEEQCGPLMRKYFPEVTLDQVVPSPSPETLRW